MTEFYKKGYSDETNNHQMIDWFKNDKDKEDYMKGRVDAFNDKKKINLKTNECNKN